MDPKLYFPFCPPDFGGVLLPWRYWQSPTTWMTEGKLMLWSYSPHVVGVA